MEELFDNNLLQGKGIANLAVTATGFKMISDKLNVISDKLDEVSGILKKVERMVDEKNIVETYRKLVSLLKKQYFNFLHSRIFFPIRKDSAAFLSPILLITHPSTEDFDAANRNVKGK